MTPTLIRSFAPITRPDALLSDLAANATEEVPSAPIRKSRRFCSDIELLFERKTHYRTPLESGRRTRVPPRPGCETKKRMSTLHSLLTEQANAASAGIDAVST